MSSNLTGAIQSIIERRSAPSRGLIADRASDPQIAAKGFARSGVLLEALGNPQVAISTAHIAGSKGKGTTAHLLAGLLAATGRTTGLYTSPHLLHWNERIAVDGSPIPDDDFVALLRHVDETMRDLEATSAIDGTFNAFELLTAAAFLAFRESKCDVAVIEVGLGGRFDPTNHVRAAVTVITTVELEHASVLGPDLATIAWNKAGIIKSGTPVICQRQLPAALAVIEKEADGHSAPLLLEGRDWAAWQGNGTSITFGSLQIDEIRLRLPGPHNAANLGAAVVSANHLVGPDELPPNLVHPVVGTIQVPGRFTVIAHPDTGQRFVLDVAHTAQSLDYLIAAVRDEYYPGRTTFAVSFLDDKPWPDLVRGLVTPADSFIFPQVPGVRAVPPDHLARVARAAGATNVTVGTLDDVINCSRDDGAPVVVTGSFGIVGEILRAFEGLGRRTT